MNSFMGFMGCTFFLGDFPKAKPCEIIRKHTTTINFFFIISIFYTQRLGDTEYFVKVIVMVIVTIIVTVFRYIISMRISLLKKSDQKPFLSKPQTVRLLPSKKLWPHHRNSAHPYRS